MIPKSQEEFCFKYISSYDISHISKHISGFDSEWKINTSRQDQQNPVHKNTESYFILGNIGEWVPGKNILPINVCRDKQLWKMVRPIIRDLERFHAGVASSAMIVKLMSEKDVMPHIDESEYLKSVRRSHIAIKTNDSVIFHVDKETKNIKTGECWEINNSKTHFVENNSDEERVHLIIDVMPYKVIGENNV